MCENCTVPTWCDYQNPALSRWAAQNGYRVQWVDRQRLDTTRMLLVDRKSVQNLLGLVKGDGDLMDYLNKRPLVLVEPAPITPLTVLESLVVGAIVASHDFMGLGEALCRQQLSDEVQQFSQIFGVRSESLGKTEFALEDFSLPGRLYYDIEYCTACKARVSDEIKHFQQVVDQERRRAVQELSAVNRLNRFTVEATRQMKAHADDPEASRAAFEKFVLDMESEIRSDPAFNREQRSMARELIRDLKNEARGADPTIFADDSSSSDDDGIPPELRDFLATLGLPVDGVKIVEFGGHPDVDLGSVFGTQPPAQA